MTFPSTVTATRNASLVLPTETARMRLAALQAEARELLEPPSDEAEALALARGFAAATLYAFWQHVAPSARELRPCFVALSSAVLTSTQTALAQRIGALAAALGPEVAAAAIGELYTALLPAPFRKQHGIFYTPVPLAELLIKRAAAAGVDWRTARLLDPACGGGALLLPALRRLLATMPDRQPQQLLAAIGVRLRGYDLDPFAAWLAQVAIDAVLLPWALRSDDPLPRVIHVHDALAPDVTKPAYDVVIGNPPYGHIALDDEQKARFGRSTFGRVNRYGLFLDQATRLARPGGTIAFMTPASYLGGEYFKRLRGLLAAEAPPVAIGFLAARKGVFEDVLQECAITILRMGARPEPIELSEVLVEPRRVLVAHIGTGFLPDNSSAPWLLPRTRAQAARLSELSASPESVADWGYVVRTGQIDGSRRFPGEGARVPLLWPQAIERAALAWPEAKPGRSPWFSSGGKEHLLIRSSCVLVKRTTSREQDRRLVAALLPQSFLDSHGGAVAIENHVNVLAPLGENAAVPPSVLAALLNSEAADDLFRCISGSANVSAYELGFLPLPPWRRLARLTRLVTSDAPKEEIEAECVAVFSARHEERPQLARKDDSARTN